MNRVAFRALSLVTVTALGITTLATVLTGGCVFSSNGDPATSVCDAMGAFVQTCNVSSSCRAAFTRDCGKISASVSAATINGLFDCSSGTKTCGSATSALTSTCFDTTFPFEFAAESSTAAQIKLAHDYCHACAPDQANCGQLLFLPTTDAGVPPGGGSIYAAADTILEAVDSQCTPNLPFDAGAACADTFTQCAAPIVAAGIYFPTDCIVSGYTATGDAVGGTGTSDAGTSDAAAPDAG